MTDSGNREEFLGWVEQSHGRGLRKACASLLEGDSQQEFVAADVLSRAIQLLSAPESGPASTLTAVPFNN